MGTKKYEIEVDDFQHRFIIIKSTDVPTLGLKYITGNFMGEK